MANTAALMAALLLAVAPANANPGGTAAWSRIPIVTQVQRAAGAAGGEGGQWPRGPVAVSNADPGFLLLPIDVGGLYRSLDGGRNWHLTMTGWNARGANGFAIDPRNANRVIGIAGNSMDWNKDWGSSPHGLYLSTDKAASWNQVLAVNEGIGGRVAFDPSSFDPARGHCTRAFYLSRSSGLFASSDGGATWARREGSPDLGTIPAGDWTSGHETMPSLAVNERDGTIYLAGQTGVFRSGDHGVAWTRCHDRPAVSLALAADGGVLVSNGPKLFRSGDRGATWTPLPAAGLAVPGGGRIQGIAVSPADARRVLCWVAGPNFDWPRFVSHDAGATFTRVPTKPDAAVLPMNARQGHFAWSPRDPNVAYSLGGDWVTQSTDGGLSFRWSNSGYAGIMTGGGFAFSRATPDSVFLGFQDYNGATSRDGGRTWTYCNVSGEGWGGHAYAGFALNPSVMWAGAAEGWSAPRKLKISRDGGATWSFVTDASGAPLRLEGADVSCGDPGDARVGFAGSLRTADGGLTWHRMNDCDGVFDADKTLLYGRHGKTVVVSTDHGGTWTKLGEAPAAIDDLAAGDGGATVFLTAADRLYRLEAGRCTEVDTPKDQRGNTRVNTVAADPTDRRILYAGGHRDIYTTTVPVIRSTDGGRSWQPLVSDRPLGPNNPESPREVSWLRVHPVTRDLWAAGSCFGLWRFPAPQQQ